MENTIQIGKTYFISADGIKQILKEIEKRDRFYRDLKRKINVNKAKSVDKFNRNKFRGK